jgi:hypothetical protein
MELAIKATKLHRPMVRMSSGSVGFIKDFLRG